MRKWKICCAITAILLIIIVVVLVTLSFTLFKPKEPKVTTQSVTLESIDLTVDLVVFPVQIKGNATLGLVVLIDNRNYGGFKYRNSTAYINYRGNLVAEAPFEGDWIPPRAKHNISTKVIIYADKLAADGNFFTDLFSGVLNFSSSTTLHGKVNVLNIFKLKASSSSSCNISVMVVAKSVDSVCKSNIRL